MFFTRLHTLRKALKVKYVVPIVVALAARAVWKISLCMPSVQLSTMSTVVEANRKAFDQFSAQYDIQPWNQRLTTQIRTALEDRKAWLPSSTSINGKLLDYACGTGAITKALGSYFNSVKGIDLSERMVNRYNAAARESGLSPEQAYAVAGNICVEDGIPEALLAPEYFDFDLAAISLGFHHFESPPLALKLLAERLKVGSGVLIIIDFLPQEGGRHGGNGHQSHQGPIHSHGSGHHGGQSHQGHGHAVPTSGFTKDGLKKLYEDAGVGEDFEFDILPDPAVMGDFEGAPQRQLFIAKGRRVAAKL